MKLLSYRVFNYKSIIDSKDVYLSPSDGITVIAGQNESGKSSLLQALFDYEKGEFREGSERDDEPQFLPSVECTFENNSPEFFQTLAGIVWDNEFKNDFVRYFFQNNRIIKIQLDGNKEYSKRTICGETFLELKNWFEKLKSIDIDDVNAITSAFKGIKLTDANKDSNAEFMRIYSSVEDVASDLATMVHKLAPRILIFDDFNDLLPDTILVSDLKSKNTKAQGYQAVRDIEKILGVNLVEVDALTDSKRMQKQDSFKRTVTAEFNQRWKQRIGAENGATIHVMHFQGSSSNGAYFKFFIETKDGELLEPHKRSQGFKWFLSFYLHLVAENQRRARIIILFDEPGLYLHSKAQTDMLAVFEELSEKSQIIYSTHSPYLIDSNKLHRIRLIINTSDGTKAEKITTNAGGKTHDALKPVIDAIGLDMRNSFTPSMGGVNAIVEGISDYYYFKSFLHLLGIQDPVYFLPAMGAPNAHLLMELCIGWGLNWIIVFDEKGTKKEIAAIKKRFFPAEDETKDKIHILKGMDGIEDMFALSDLQLVVPEMTQNENEPIGKTVGRYGGKELVGRLFSDKVFGGEITLDKLVDTTVENFKTVFDFISEVSKAK